jgi:hypothetical protein
VFRFNLNHYAQWRTENGLAPLFRDESDTPPERLLQAIWFHQRVQRNCLRTLDGRGVQVLHPGFWNREAGPDFRGALLRFGAGAPCSGDVEVDLQSSGWRAHGHDTNPNFRDVALHVVWEGDATPNVPTLLLKPVLDSPIGELALFLGSEAGKAFPLELLGQCCAPLRGMADEPLTALLHQAAFIRLQSKAALFQSRARQAGWDQSLWEGLFRALGYKQNLWPMQRLGELRERLQPTGTRLTPFAWQARLLGAGGLLPDELTRNRTSGDRYLRQLWDLWWRERETFEDCALPKALWRFHQLRPANHPQRRLALASHWLAAGKLPARLEQWCAGKVESSELVPTLLDHLSVPEDPFWSRHWTLRSKRIPKPQPLLGPTRVTDLAVNVVLPWLWVRTVEGRNDSLRQELERRFYAWPRAEDNAVLRLARQRLLGGASKQALHGAAMQQGLLQVVKDFCEHSNALCADCRFPQLVKSWPRRAPG